MKILIIYCHPSQKSYTFQVLEYLKTVIANQQWDFEISDLYKMEFQSDMSASEYEREGLAKTDLPIPEDIVVEHKKIEDADGLIFLYPVWWSDCPAKLKGWFDRVYSRGYAYGNDLADKKMKTLKFGYGICTAGYSNVHLAESGIAQSMHTILLDDRMGQRFENKELVILGGTLELGKVKELHKRQIEGLTAKILSFG